MRVSTFIVSAVSAFLVVSIPAQAAQGTAEVHFAHAVPGLGEAELRIDGETIGRAAFGESTGSVTVPAGRAQLTVLAPDDVTLESTEVFDAGESYTLVGMANDEGAEVRRYVDGPPERGVGRIRIIHAAPELGEPDLTLNGKTLTEAMSYTQATRYWTLKPGAYDLVAEDPASGEAVLSREISVSAGTAQTALVVGSAGERAEIVLAQNDVAAPAAAPETGFGGLQSGGPQWLMAFVAALIAGLAGLATRSGAGRLLARYRA